jgi:CDP-diacylglycerol pyrophosphatase
MSGPVSTEVRGGGEVRRWPRALAALLLALCSGACHRGDPDALWKIVHQQCVPDQREHGAPAPCALVDLSAGEDRGYAVLKDRNGPYQYLLIPTARLSGIESPALLAADAPRYFAAAWEARRFVEQGYGKPLPREALSLAINSKYGRSQNQLHIHIDCVRSGVRDSLRAQLSKIGAGWAPLETPLAGRSYRAMRLSEERFLQLNPFALLAADGAMARHTLVAVGASFEDGTPGFVLLDDSADPWRLDFGHGEDLQSHSCG